MPTTDVSLRRRSLAEAGLDGPVVERFKSDARSSVWRVESARGPIVMKRFEFSPLRQRLSLWTRVHPAQIELRWNTALAAAAVPVVPVIDAGFESHGLGCKAWLATPLTGVSMQSLIRDPAVRSARGEALIAAAAELTRTLFSAGFWSRDLKPSNILIDEHGRALLIDVGSARGKHGSSAAPAAIARTLAVMDRVLARDGVEPPLRELFARLVAHRA